MDSARRNDNGHYHSHRRKPMAVTEVVAWARALRTRSAPSWVSRSVPAAGSALLSRDGVFPPGLQPAQPFEPGQDQVDCAGGQPRREADLQPVYLLRRLGQQRAQHQLYSDRHLSANHVRQMVKRHPYGNTGLSGGLRLYCLGATAQYRSVATTRPW